MATVLDVAEYILEQIEEDSIPYLKLERLCYYAQAWSMAWDEEPIFPEEFYAGEKGAVCYELFDGVGHQLFVLLADSTGTRTRFPKTAKIRLFRARLLLCIRCKTARRSHSV